MKKCNKCGQTKNKTDFFRDITRRDGLTTQCKSCIKISTQKRRPQMNERISKYYKIKAALTKKACIEYLGNSCHLCGQSFHFAAYDFHHKHIHEKEHNVGRLMKNSFQSIQPELDKCILLCANCHRTFHYELRRGINLLEMETNENK